MADKIHPTTTTTTTTPLPPPPAAWTKPEPELILPIPFRHHPYRPPIIPSPEPSFFRRRRLTVNQQRCLWSAVAVLTVLFLAGVASIAFYLLYHPRSPQFSAVSLRISYFHHDTSPSDGTTHLTTNMNVTLASKNPNGKITFSYHDPVKVTVLSSSDVALSSNGTFSAFHSTPGSISVLHATVGLTSQLLDVDSVNSLKADMVGRHGLLGVKIVMDTVVDVRFKKLKIMRKMGIRVKCDGIRGVLPKGKKVISSDTSDAGCKVELRILKWT